MSSDEDPSGSSEDSGDTASDLSEDHSEEPGGVSEDEDIFVLSPETTNDVPLGDRLQSLADGSGSRAVLAQRHDRWKHTEGKRKAPEDENEETGPRKRASKHAPVEEKISRRPVPVLRDAMQKKGVHRLDPRFMPVGESSVSGKDSESARRRYGFLFNDAMPAEVKELQAQLKRSSNDTERRRLQVRISKLQQVLKREEDKDIELEVEREWKTEEKAKVASGKEVFYLKASEKKKRVLAKKFEKLREAGQLDKYMEKRRKRSAAKDHKKLPFRSR